MNLLVLVVDTLASRTEKTQLMNARFYLESEYPTIAQLVERLTVEDMWRSGGPWFESGWSDVFVLFLQTNKFTDNFKNAYYSNVGNLP